jgi:hypothetical protein
VVIINCSALLSKVALADISLDAAMFVSDEATSWAYPDVEDFKE